MQPKHQRYHDKQLALGNKAYNRRIPSEFFTSMDNHLAKLKANKQLNEDNRSDPWKGR